jgi:hypothetical protein
MRQVPDPSPVPFGVVGNGRLARHVSHYFHLLGLPFRSWSRRSAGVPPPQALAGCGTVLLLIRDDAIGPFADAWPALRGHRLVHCAGGLRVPGIAAAHPLMAFGDGVYDLSTYRSVPFVLDQDGPPFGDLLPGLPNLSYRVPAEQRAYYHALCVMAGNFTTLLWQKLFDELQARFGIPPSAAHAYLRRVAGNLAADPAGALTGPLARGDTRTLDANLHALAGDPYQAVYAAFVRAHAHRS